MVKTDPYNFYRYRQLQIDDTVVTPNKLRRRLNILKKWSDSFEGFYPTEVYRDAYWNFKIPILNSIVNGDVAFNIRQECIQYLVNAICHIINAKSLSNIEDKSKIMCLVSIPNMHDSEITVFTSRSYYENFFIRNTKEHKLNFISEGGRSLLKEFNVKIPNNSILQEKGYIETIDDEDFKYCGELWAIGQLDNW